MAQDEDKEKDNESRAEQKRNSKTMLANLVDDFGGLIRCKDDSAAGAIAGYGSA
jgi:hypothetical protein